MAKWLKVLLLSFALALIPTVVTFSFASDLFTIKRVIDGDTLLLGNGERVRLIGVDTPEVHGSNKLQRDAERTQTDIATIRRLGQKSSAFVKKVVQGKRVRLEYDQANLS
jgi:micrococcal nuclease